MRSIGHMYAGYIALVVPVLFILFGLFNVIRVGWRNWFGFGTKDLSRKKKRAIRPVPPRLRPPPDRG